MNEEFLVSVLLAIFWYLLAGFLFYEAYLIGNGQGDVSLILQTIHYMQSAR